MLPCFFFLIQSYPKCLVRLKVSLVPVFVSDLGCCACGWYLMWKQIGCGVWGRDQILCFVCMCVCAQRSKWLAIVANHPFALHQSCGLSQSLTFRSSLTSHSSDELTDLSKEKNFGGIPSAWKGPISCHPETLHQFHALQTFPREKTRRRCRCCRNQWSQRLGVLMRAFLLDWGAR